MAIRAPKLPIQCPTLVESFEATRSTPFDDALRDLFVLFANAATLNDANRRLQLFGAKAVGQKATKKNPFKNLEAAHLALHKHDVYRWLDRKLPQTMEQLRALAPVVEFETVLNLLSLLIQLACPPAPPQSKKQRPDKRRETAGETVARLEAYVSDGTIKLTPDKRALLSRLLSEAKIELASGHPKSVDHPALLMIACRFALLPLTEPSKLLMEIAGLAGVTDYSTLTAQRDVKRAAKLSSHRLTTDWHLFDELARDYRTRPKA
jgi:hypothetical protein